MKIYCFGNRLLKSDRLPLILIPELKKEFPKIKFIEANSPDEIEDESEINIIDTIKGIERVSLITNIESIENFCLERNCSLHDFDLAITLKLMKKIGKLKQIRIFGIPMNYPKKRALAELKNLLSIY